jgi:Peptidase family M28
MRILTIGALIASLAVPTAAQRGNPPSANDPIRTLVEQLSLEKYKATIKGLTQFGDRRAGTDRNRAAIDWIEAQLKSYGCTNTERLKYEYPLQGAARAGGATGSRIRGTRARTGVNNDPNAQPDPQLRALNSQPAANGPREEVYCTKIGATLPQEMYIVSAHMDGIGWGEAANDDGSGTALVMELARVLHGPGVQTERSIRFILWNNEETGLEGSRAYAAQRKHLQGKEDPPGSGRYPEPKWLGVIQHDMMMFDHGMPKPDGTVSKDQRPEADINVEFQSNSMFAAQSQTLAFALEAANVTYAVDYPVTVGAHMQSTDSASFQDLVAAVSVRENERGAHIGAGWDPHWHQPTDVFATFSDADFRLGLNAAQTTMGALGRLAGIKVTN